MNWSKKDLPKSIETALLTSTISINTVIKTILIQRNIRNNTQAKIFLYPSLDSLHDPLLMYGMEAAIDRIHFARIKKESIMIYGDYDVDGVTSVSLMYLFLKIHFNKIEYYIPDREKEGYGISCAGIDYAVTKKVSLIIALDCGIKDIEKVSYAKERGVDCIICDHHLPGDILPDAYAILNPKQKKCTYPFKELCGCGIGFKLIQALSTKWHISKENIYSYIDLVALATAADIVPMIGENRTIASLGLKEINKNSRVGLKYFVQKLKKPLNIRDVIFGLAPSINAAGRLEKAVLSLELLICSDEKESILKAKYIEQLNFKRKYLEKRITEEAIQQIVKNKEEENFSTIVADKNWHKGVIGIVASRLVDSYYRPTIVFKENEKTGLYTGSARSIADLSIIKILDKCKQFIEKYGGHHAAAGLSIRKENFIPFKKHFESCLKEKLRQKPEKQIVYDMEIPIKLVSKELFTQIQRLEPFGPKNMRPIFRSYILSKSIHTSKAVGEDNAHLRIEIQKNTEETISGIAFGYGEFAQIIQRQNFEILYVIEENTWNDKTNLQLQIRDLRMVEN